MDEVNEEGEEEEQVGQLLLDRLRAAVIGVAETQAQRNGLCISQPVMAALCDMTHKFAEELGKELQLFASHAGRKSINMDDVILAARRNDDVAAVLKAISRDLGKPPLDKKRKKATASAAHDQVVID